MIKTEAPPRTLSMRALRPFFASVMLARFIWLK
jgi:hypothetical protein